MFTRLISFLCLLSFCLTSCYRVPRTIEPVLVSPPHPREIEKERGICLNLPDSFSTCPFFPLTAEEEQTEWGKEVKIGRLFANDFDLYRAITSFKRALFMIPPEDSKRRLEIEYDIALAYYLGKKYVETICAIEGTALIACDQTFPAFHDMLLILYDSYKNTSREAQAAHILSLIENYDVDIAQKISILSALERGDLGFLENMGCVDENRSYLCQMISNYNMEAKSIKKAEFLNAVFPGAGYWYVGQKETAITAFIINSLFIAAAIQFFNNGNTAAGIITLSFESGWYFGGICGAGLAAKTYNEHLFEGYAEKVFCKEKPYPLMMLRYTF